MRRGPTIGRLLVGLNAVVLLVPVLALVLLRIYDSHLLEQTERRLIGEAAVIGEAFRSALFSARGEDVGGDAPLLPPEHDHDRFWSIEPTVDLDDSVAPASPRGREVPLAPDYAAAGRAVGPMLARVTRLNLSSARVMDPRGCLVATTGDDADTCFDTYPEVQTALGGRYAAVTRERGGASRVVVPPDGLSRHGDTRVFVALPVFHAGEVIGVVRMGRTSLNAFEALWRHRGTLAAAALVCLALTLGISWYLSRTIGRPMRAIREAAQDIARGRARRLIPAGRVPAELADMSASLDAMHAQLSARAEYVRDFAAAVSHELKTPLTGIRGATELLVDSWEAMSDAERRRFLHNIDADATRMQQLVTGLLALARVENTGDDASSHETFAVAEAIRAVSPADVAVVVRDAGAGVVTTRRDHFELALRNLVENARIHGAPPVEVRVERAGSETRIHVEDHGVGVSEGNQGKVFERFFTTRRDAGGTGLGLAIARAAARTWGGTVVYTHVGDRTRFTMSLPDQTG